MLENLFGRVESVYAQAATHIPARFDEAGHAYPATADDAAYAIFELDGGVDRAAQLQLDRPRRPHELVEFQVDGTHGSAVAGLFGCRIQPGNPPRSRCGTPIWRVSHDYAKDWMEVPDNDAVENGFKTQWEQFIRHVVEDAPHEFDLLAGARGVQLAAAGAARRPPRVAASTCPIVTLEASTDAASAADAASRASQAAELTGAR